MCRAELSLLRGPSEVGDPASVPADPRRGNPAAGVWSHGSTHPSVPVAQKQCPRPQRHQEETHGEERLLKNVEICSLLLVWRLLTRCLFQIPHSLQDHHGRYRCEISSSTERMWTNEVDVVIGTAHSDFLTSVKPAVITCE